jgi:hypothetical protein
MAKLGRVRRREIAKMYLLDDVLAWRPDGRCLRGVAIAWRQRCGPHIDCRHGIPLRNPPACLSGVA